MKMSVLKKRARDMGVAAASLERAYDEESPREALVSILVEAQLAAAAGASAAVADDADGDTVATSVLRAELAAMKLSVLKRRGLAAGVEPEAMDQVLDEDDPKAAMVEILVAAEREARLSAQSTKEKEVEALRAELGSLKLSAVRRRAIESGVSEENLDVADDSDDVKAAVVELVIEQEARVAEAKVKVKATAGSADRPHFGSATQVGKAVAVADEAEAAASGLHVMLVGSGSFPAFACCLRRVLVVENLMAQWHWCRVYPAPELSMGHPGACGGGAGAAVAAEDPDLDG